MIVKKLILLRSVSVTSYLSSKASNNIPAFFFLSHLLKHTAKFILSREEAFSYMFWEAYIAVPVLRLIYDLTFCIQKAMQQDGVK